MKTCDQCKHSVSWEESGNSLMDCGRKDLPEYVLERIYNAGSMNDFIEVAQHCPKFEERDGPDYDINPEPL